METIITKSQVADAVYAAIPRLACELPADIEAGIASARAVEDNPRGRAVLDQLAENARIAREDRVPICQDTGTVWASLEIGPDVLVRGDVFADVASASSRRSSSAARRALKSTMGTPAPGCVLLPQKYRPSHASALLCGRQ
ncbi:fumarate hydratase [Gordonibacter pamelaeae]|uniref:fumarate hydratase n=1 Tax=Gordonibacter pamelaeae TaxID=471189 RepID=UPI001E59DD35|nr:fumarate hydratase [Gordonibacter pamelaeae]